VVDIFGGVFSILSLVFKPKLDAIATVTYTLVVVSCSLLIVQTVFYVTEKVMDAAILIAAICLNPRAKRRRERLGGVSESATVVERRTASPEGAETAKVDESPLGTLTLNPSPQDVEKQSIKNTL
jgi:hypothetical protein